MPLHSKMTMGEAFNSVVETHANHIALICGNERITYRQLAARIDKKSLDLLELGITKGDKIACLLSPGIEFASLFFALANIGAIIVPLNPQLREQSILNFLKDFEPVILVSSQALPAVMLSGLPSLRYFIHTLPGERDSSVTALSASKKATISRDTLKILPIDLLALLYTSGTTGMAKCTMHTHGSLIAPVAASTKLRELWLRKPGLKTIAQTAKALRRYRKRLLSAIGKPQIFLSTVPWHTITGLETMLQPLLMGDRLVVMPRFHPRLALELVEREQVTILIAVPTAYQMMLSLNEFDQFNKDSLLICGTGAAPCPKELAIQMQKRFGCAVHIGFGATETAGGIAATSIADSDENQVSTVGHPMPGMEVKIVDENNWVLPPGQVGELICRSESLMHGYYKEPGLTAQVIDKNGWYHTGDLAIMDNQGFLRITGRKNDVIIRGGQNVYPEEIEAYLETHVKIKEAAVVGIPSAVSGESIWADVILEDGSKMSAQEVLDYCRETLEVYKIPQQIRFVSDFPRSESGKPQKYIIRDQIISSMEKNNAKRSW